MPVSWQTRLRSLSATLTLRWIVSRTRRPGTEVSRPRAAASASRRSCGMSFSAHTYRYAAASSTAPWTSVATASGIVVDGDDVGVELHRGASLLVRSEAGALRAAERHMHLRTGRLRVDVQDARAEPGDETLRRLEALRVQRPREPEPNRV